MRHTGFAAVGAVAVMGAGAFALPAMGSASHAEHTLKFTAVALKTASLSQAEFGQAEVDRRAGKVVGFDVIYGSFKSGKGVGRVTFSTKGGVMYGKLTFSDGPVTTGTVTGGTGTFKGATGTIRGKNLNKSGTRTAVTIKYH